MIDGNWLVYRDADETAPRVPSFTLSSHKLEDLGLHFQPIEDVLRETVTSLKESGWLPWSWKCFICQLCLLQIWCRTFCFVTKSLTKLYNPFKKKYISHFKGLEDPLLENAMLTDNKGQESPVVCVNDPAFRYTHVEFSPSDNHVPQTGRV